MSDNGHLTGHKVDATGRSAGKLANSRFKKYVSPPAPFAWITAEMMESPAWAAMSGAALKALMRIAHEHVGHKGLKNGMLPVTHRNFTGVGLHKDSVRPALIELEVLGFVRRTSNGHRSWGEYKGAPATFRLTYLGDHEGSAPTNEWRRHKTLGDAREAVARAKEADEKKRAKTKSPPPESLPTDPKPLRTAVNK
ncbi:hypothetical protein [Methylobacterium sp. WSM2598]|uniref:hypothetical protein n=1 Tax=Methylobacterium sp. WSM2598 TaxID=398261 RepID=UPI0003AAC0ED|nr:hypothetical protein [Methylobacterium sp. WSM2598]